MIVLTGPVDHVEERNHEPELPAAYAIALEARRQGADPDEIARRTEVPVEAVPALLRLADAKAAALREQPAAS